MSRLQSFIILSVIICTILAPLAAAQGALPFTIRVQQADTVSDIGDGGEVLMETGAVGLPATASVTMTYLGVEATQIDEINLLAAS